MNGKIHFKNDVVALVCRNANTGAGPALLATKLFALTRVCTRSNTLSRELSRTSEIK